MEEQVGVVIVTLNRPTLKHTVKAVKQAIPNSNIIYVTGKGVIGELRNEGLQRSTSALTCFVDDDIIVNRDWFIKCKNVLEANPDVIAAFGVTQTGATEGAMVCKTEAFKKAGGYPKLDNYVWNTLGNRIVMVDNAVAHNCSVECGVHIKHTLYWMCRGFNTETKVGSYHNPITEIRDMLTNWRKISAETLISEFLWFLKTMFILPFILGKNKPLKAHINHVTAYVD